jgi:phospholipid-binding lipoprotein MlaA
MTSRYKIIAAAVVLLLLNGCASTGASKQAQWDPLEPVNRGIFKFNRSADKLVLRPIAVGYQKITPTPVRAGIGNFFANLSMPVVFVSDLLQGKPKAAGSDAVRFLLNSTVGVGGLFDVATGAGIEKNQEDFGQTLAVWGVGDGPYLMVPLLGPYSFRHGFGTVADTFVSPLYQYENLEVRDKLIILSAIDLREGLLSADEILDNSLDPYLALRDAYFQSRLGLIYDGEPPLEDEAFEDEFNEEDFLDE